MLTNYSKMRRTYRSKKDTGDGLDHKDVLLNLDEKTSTFEAFYIQNIKQTKRELSCISSSNHHGVCSNKVRKRRYIKRVKKEVEPPVRELGESLSTSVFLTPDKSFRVNKAPDLFDQLLNSSPSPKVLKQTKQENLFDKLLSQRSGKTYGRGKPSNTKKLIITNSLESDKENTKHNTDSQNLSDVKAHELLVEKEHQHTKKFDESINNIVKSLSLLNSLNHKSLDGSVKKTFKYNRNRLTHNVQSPSLQSSPLSSTPFSSKYRSKSIYKFSPIPMGNFDESPDYVTVIEENPHNESLQIVPNICNNVPKTEDSISPVTHLQNSFNSKPKINKSIFKKLDRHSQSSSSVDIENATVAYVDNKLNSNNDGNFTQISEHEPFIGFSDRAENNSDMKYTGKDNSIILSLPKLPKKSKDISSGKDDIIVSKNVCKSMENMEDTVPSQPFLGFSNVDIDNNEDINISVVFPVTTSFKGSNSKTCEIRSDNSLNKDCISKDEPASNLSIFDYIAPTDSGKATNTDIDNKRNICDELLSCSGHSSTCEDNILDSPDTDRESFYDTCDSEQSSLIENVQKTPIVKIERINDSLFQRYYEKMPGYQCDRESINSNDSHDSYVSFTSNDFSDSLDSMETDDNQKDSDYEPSDTFAEKDITSTEDDDCLSYYEETKPDTTIYNKQTIEEECCISFVTTRRKNEINNKSAILVLDDSTISSTSTDCDKTVLNYKPNFNNVENVTSDKSENVTKNIKTNSSEGYLENIEDVKPVDSRLSNVASRKISRLSTENDQYREIKSTDLAKPGIVLQPGKKWERSLSIYRRMTMYTDHFDQSILEDEDLQAKGRKYRQSVMETMELQDTIGSLHNESFHNRRSTFVSKPSRSTIRIVKEPSSRISLGSTTVIDDLKGFLEDCDDTVVELSKLSITDPDHEVTVLEQFHEGTRVATARDYVLRRCNQTETLLFDECYPETVLKNCRKIGEGVYGEVFLWRATDGRARVMKIVPIAGTVKVNGENQKDFHEIISEIVIAMELSALRAPIATIECNFDEGKDVDALDLHSLENATDVFNEVLAVRCVYGNYPSRLLDLWELYDECKGSENDNPAILPLDQQYIVLELANAGQDLESYQFNSAEQAHALFLQVAFGLAVGEEAFQFEHRDLHWGNVLIAPTEQKYATFVLRGRAHRVPRRGVAATIIDYSLSRLSLPLAPRDSAALYNDLAADDGLFGAVGDYQFEVYRLMRDKLRNDWKNFEPYTNILWLHYTVDKMITALRYKRTNTKTHKQYIAKLKGIKDRILNYGSAAQFVLTDNEY